MPQLVEVAFGGNRKEFFNWGGEETFSLRTAVIVEAERGEDLGYVHSTGELASVRCSGCAHGCGSNEPSRSVLRPASKSDVETANELRTENQDARKSAMERVKTHNLVMKITDAEWQWDRNKITFYFTAERRVDFRELVRDLATVFRTRIELKHIGVRDEAKRLSGIGRCGREYCSSSWLPDLRPVNLGVAKDQRLSLNPQQISGACGRLMCCLKYEHNFYVQSRRRFPKEGRVLDTAHGQERVVSCDIFNELVTLRSVDGDTRVVPLSDLKAEVASGAANAVAVQAIDANSFSDGNERSSELSHHFGLAEESDYYDEEADEADDADARVDYDIADHEASDDFIDSNDEALSENPSENTSEADARRKRRRGRRGGRRLRNNNSNNE